MALQTPCFTCNKIVISMSTQKGCNLGALTTTWTEPQPCTRQFQFVSTSGRFDGSAVLAVGFDCTSFPGYYCYGPSGSFWAPQTSVLVTSPGVSSCIPHDSYQAKRDSSCQPSNGGYLWDYYSPGLVCPLGYTTACLSISAGTYDFQFDFRISDGETAAGCCPSNFKCGYLDETQICVYSITNTAAYRILCSSTISSIEAYEIPLTYVTRLPGRDDGPRTLTKTETPMYAPMYRLNWHNSDRPVSASTHHTIDITSPPVQPTTTETRKGFTKDAKIGIIVGATAGGLVLIAFLAWIARSIRRAKKTPSRPKVPTRNELFGQIDARGSSGNQPYELD